MSEPVEGGVEFGPLRVAVAGGVASVTIDSPPTNLVGGAFLAGLTQLMDALEPDPGVRAAVFASADPDF
jgi:enoyl-CoA hydratase/carnithine racemase